MIDSQGRSKVRIVPIDADVAAHVRARRKDPQYGYPVTSDIADGYGPCRSCLQKFEVGRDRRLLFTYDPFDGIEPYPQPGPVFIHEDACQTYAEGDAFPSALRDIDYTLEAYAFGPTLVRLERVAGRDVDEPLARLLSDDAVDYIHVRNTDAGCFDFRVQRVSKC